MSDLECPYCGSAQEVCHDDGFGYEEDGPHEVECHSCEKLYIFRTSILFVYHEQKADCLNGEDHKWKATMTVPREYTRMACIDCGDERKPTEEEWPHILGKSIV